MSLERGWKTDPEKMIPKEELNFHELGFKNGRYISWKAKLSQGTKRQMKKEHTRRFRRNRKLVCHQEYSKLEE